MPEALCSTLSLQASGALELKVFKLYDLIGEVSAVALQSNARIYLGSHPADANQAHAYMPTWQSHVAAHSIWANASISLAAILLTKIVLAHTVALCGCPLCV